MPSYVYRAVDLETSTPVEGSVEAADEREARLSLRARGMMPLSVHSSEDSGRSDPRIQRLVAELTYRPVKAQDLSIYTAQLASLIEAGLPIIEVMVTMEDQTAHPTLRSATAEVRKDLLGGLMLSEAVARHPRIFPPLFVSLVEAGEKSGALEVMLSRLAETLEKNLEVQRKVKAALTYPMMVSVTLVAVVSLLLVVVVPNFKSLYAKAGAALPLPTRILLVFSDFARTQWGWIVALVVVGVLAYRWFRRTEVGRPIVDRLWLRAPIFGPLLLEQTANTFTRAFGTVYGAGVPVVSALECCRKVVTNAAISEVLKNAEDQVRVGRNLAAELQNTHYFPKILAQMIAIGEASGKIEELIERAVGFSDKSVDFKIRQMTTMLEPILTVVIGLVVMFIALAMYLPMFELPKLLGGSAG